MLSGVSGGSRPTGVSSSRQLDEVYDLRGLNLVAPDQVMPVGQTPYAINNRRFAREESESRVAVRTRKGSIYLSTPVGETMDVNSNTATTSDLSFSATKWLAWPFEAGANDALTKLDLRIKREAGSTGYVIIEVYTDIDGYPGTLIAQSSIAPSTITTSYAYLSAHFIDAPLLTDGDDYWVVVKTQELGLNSYYLSAFAGPTMLVSEDERATYTNVNLSVNYKTYLSTDGAIKGFNRRYPQNGENRTLFVLGGTLYEVADNPADPAVLDATIDTGAEVVRFADIDDKTIYVTGKGTAKWWDGDVAPTTIANVGGTPHLVIVFQNRLLFVDPADPTRVKFSALYSFEDYPSVNFFYVPSPKSPDHITGWRVFKDDLVIFTHETKHVVIGSDISTFTRKEAIGTKGAVSDEAIAVGKNVIYFMGDDGQIYAWNGASDTLISENMEPEFNAIINKKGVRMHVYRNQLHVYYAKTPDVTVNHKAVYDIESGEWFMDTGRPVVGSLEWYLDDNELIEFSSKVGAFYRGEVGYSDMGKAIDFKYWTRYNMYGSGAAKDRIKKFRPVVRPADQDYYLSVGKDIDFENRPDMRDWLVSSGGATWGNFVWGDGTRYGGKKMIDNKVTMSGRGKHTQYRFEKSGVETPVELLGYIAIYKSGRAR